MRCKIQLGRVCKRLMSCPRRKFQLRKLCMLNSRSSVCKFLLHKPCKQMIQYRYKIRLDKQRYMQIDQIHCMIQLRKTHTLIGLMC